MQYGIRLSIEDISYGEYKRLFGGLTGDTPLCQIISIRKEKDPKKIKQFSKEDKKIFDDWRRRQVKKTIQCMSFEERQKRVMAFQSSMKEAFCQKRGEKR